MARGVPAGLTRFRKPAVAGLFYPAQPAALLTSVQELLAEPHVAESSSAIAIIVPHSGYQYSGRTAGEVFARTDIPRRCVIAGPNHSGVSSARHAGSAYAVGAFRTPMGDVPVDETLVADLLARCDLLEDDPDAHRTEHGIEVLLPFLLAQRPDVVVTPLVIGWADWPRSRSLGEALAATVRQAGEPVLLIASSDMNHFEPAADADGKDALALDTIARVDGEALLDVTKKNRISVCGRTAAAAILHAARLLGATAGTVVHRSHSGQMTLDDSAVVSYAGVVIT